MSGLKIPRFLNFFLLRLVAEPFKDIVAKQFPIAI